MSLSSTIQQNLLVFRKFSSDLPSLRKHAECYKNVVDLIDAWLALYSQVLIVKPRFYSHNPHVNSMLALANCYDKQAAYEEIEKAIFDLVPLKENYFPNAESVNRNGYFEK